MWDAAPEMVAQLKEIYLDIEGEIEGRTALLYPAAFKNWRLIRRSFSNACRTEFINPATKAP